MNLQAAVAQLAELPAKIADALKGASALAEKNATLSADNAKLTARVAELEASAKSATDAAEQAKAAAAKAADEKQKAEAEAQRLAAEAKNVDTQAEAKAKAILASQGTVPVSDKSTPAASTDKFVGPDGKPLTGLARSLAIKRAEHAAKAAA